MDALARNETADIVNRRVERSILVWLLTCMTKIEHDDDGLGKRLELARLLDERYRLREDPGRRGKLLRTHEQLRDLLRDAMATGGPESDEH